MGKPPGPAPQLKHTLFHEPHATMTRRIGDAAGRGRRNSGRGPKSCCVKVVRLKGKYVRSPASRPPSRCGPSSGKHPNIRTSHPLALECSETRKRVVELRCPVTVPREIDSLSRMNDDRTNIIVSQQRRDLVFGDWTSATIFGLYRSDRPRDSPTRIHSDEVALAEIHSDRSNRVIVRSDVSHGHAAPWSRTISATSSAGRDMAVAAYGEGRENNPIQSSFWVRFMLQDKEKLASPSNCKHPGSSCPQQPP